MQNCLFSFLFIISLTGCFDDGGSEGKSLVNIYLVDAPGDFDQAWIEIDRVEIMTGNTEGTPSGNWTALDYIPLRNTVNVSSLVDGTSLILGRTELSIGKITQIKLVLRNGHYLIKDEQRIELPMADTASTEVIVDTDFDLESAMSYDIMLDFDLDGSIKTDGTSTTSFVLSPKIRAFSTLASAAISGSISPVNARPVVYLIQGQDTLTTRTSNQGRFLFQGLDEGAYNVSIQPLAPYLDSLLTGIPVQTGMVTVIENILLENPEIEEEEDEGGENEEGDEENGETPEE